MLGLRYQNVDFHGVIGSGEVFGDESVLTEFATSQQKLQHADRAAQRQAEKDKFEAERHAKNKNKLDAEKLKLEEEER